MDEYHVSKKICRLTLPPGYRYLVFGQVIATIDADNIMSLGLYTEGGAYHEGSDNFVASRTTMISGGGCSGIGIFHVYGTDGIITMDSYRYYLDRDYDIHGTLSAIPLTSL